MELSVISGVQDEEAVKLSDLQRAFADRVSQLLRHRALIILFGSAIHEPRMPAPGDGTLREVEAPYRSPRSGPPQLFWLGVFSKNQGWAVRAV